MPAEFVEVKLVDCSMCGKPCIGESLAKIPNRKFKPRYRRLARIVVRVDNRPRCNRCVDESARLAEVRGEPTYERKVFRVIQ